MDEPTMRRLAELAGLTKALAEFPQDVAQAAAQAGGHRETIQTPTNPAAEPWPPMRTRAVR